MKLRYLMIAVIGIVVGVAFHNAVGAERERLETLIFEVLNQNPMIFSAQSSWQSEKYAVTHARTLPDPVAMYGYYGESVETRVGPMKHKVGASQKIPFPGKLIFQGKVQQKAADISGEEFEATKREIVKEVKTTYYDIFWVDKAIQITQGEKSILENLERVAQRKYETGNAPQQDVIKAHVGISELMDRLYSLKERRESLVSKMNSLLNRPRYTPFGGVVDVEESRFSYALGELRDMAGTSRQELKGAKIAIEKARHEKTLAKMNYVPDLTFGFDYTFIGKGTTTMANDGKDDWIGTVSLNVPIWFNKLSADVKAKKAGAEAAKRNYEEAKNTVDYEVESLFYRINANRDIINLYRNVLIPQTEQSFEAARTGYESGAVDFLNWLDAEKTLLQTRLTYYKAISDYQISIAQMERVVGQDL